MVKLKITNKQKDIRNILEIEQKSTINQQINIHNN